MPQTQIFQNAQANEKLILAVPELTWPNIALLRLRSIHPSLPRCIEWQLLALERTSRLAWMG